MSTNPTTDAGNIAGTPLTDAYKGYWVTKWIDGKSIFDLAADLEAQLTKSREATAQAERRADMLALIVTGKETDFEKLVNNLAAARAERDGRETDLMIALTDLASETAKNAELQGYIRKLANLLGCTDGDDSPELGIKEMVADRAALREKLKVAETAIRTLGRCASCNGSGKPVCTSSDRQECTPNCGCKEPCCYTCKGDGLKGAARKMIAALRGNDKAEKGAGE